MGVTAKGMGKVQEARGAIQGLRGIFLTLAKEHGEAASLLTQASKSSTAEEWNDLFSEVRKELLAHEHGELAVLYPHLQSRNETKGMAADHNSEAEELETVIDRLAALSFNDPQRDLLTKRLISMVEHHAQKEESAYFPEAQEALGEDQAETLDETYQGKKQEIMRGPG